MDSVPLICTEGRHKPQYLAVLITACALLVVHLIVTYEAWFGWLGLFGVPVFATFSHTGVMFSPALWCMAVVWTVVYMWQGAWMAHGITTTRRKTSYGFLYVAPGHLHPEIHGLFCASLVCQLVWVGLWEASSPGLAMVLIVLANVFMILAVIVAMRRLYIRGPALISEWETQELWFTRFFLHNGLAIYGAWLGYVFLLNLGLVIHRYSDLTVDITGTICLAAALVMTSTYFVVDVFMFDRYTRYVFTPYLIDLMYPLGVISSHWEVEDSSSALSAMLFGISLVFLVSKVALMTYRHLRNPMYQDEDSCFPARQNYGTIEYENTKYEGE